MASVIITPTDAEIDAVRGYRIGVWHLASGQNDDEGRPIPGKPVPNYECVDCQFSTIFKAKIQKHVDEGDHPWSYPLGHSVEEEEDSGEPEY